uniref:Caspase-8 n=1 Tax=Lepisosteus oculatus TaxID=7918 RepID=W5MXV3_LEPOC|nr:PREDICTED: caspase-8-like [Lepisosteus oculatus]XP_015214954.1 PREDICTED: caspase-8-like [Lepisosteus oculatus]XP_015214955.1 PREDICTED: caspase-8-like [Lepisosteus oculatus]XP_015214956.1 PREDICTED: caspase-8-like [Lepisosteus oculatus]XP_015214957.1 PREDICTED: caspase-8-like [Lepisosteus oculatus]
MATAINDLFQITEQLSTDDVPALRFLCSDLITAKSQEKIVDGKGLILELRKASLVEEGDCFILAELLYWIGQNKLLKYMNVTKEMVQEQLQNNNVSRVSPFRKILYEVSQDISSDDLNNMKFLLSDKFGASLENMDIYDIFTAMEKREMLADNNFEELKKIFGQMSPRLLKKIEDYETHNKDKPLQEESEVVSNLSQMSLCNTTEQGKPVSQEESCVIQNKEYKMSSLPRGYCLILNNFDFVEKRIQNRWGTEHDAKALEEVFCWLGFEVKRHDDLKAAEMRAKLEEYGKASHQGKDCFVCCVLSHGEQQCVVGTDGEKVEIKDIVSCFDGKKCPSLVQKPKVFFIQACQGKEFQESVEAQGDGCFPVVRLESDDSGIYRVPVDADVLIGMATVQECLSMRDVRSGTWYIQSLCRQLREGCPRGDDIHSILTKVNEEVSKEEGTIKRIKLAKQIPEPRYTLTKKLVFRVP